MFRVMFIASVLALVTMSLSACAESVNCQITNPALESMAPVEVIITREDGSTLKVSGLLADDGQTRSAGFQRVCESTIEDSPILFQFDIEVMPRFHMNNVVAPIDIAFIDKQGRIESIQSMQPYVLGSTRKPLYSPARPIVAALEVHKGFFTDNAVSLTSTVTWQPRDTDEAAQQKD